MKKVLTAALILLSINGYSQIYTRVDSSTLRVVKPLVTASTTNEYNIDFLLKQEQDILKSKADFIKARDLELVEVRKLIAECVRLGIKSKIIIPL